MTGPLYGILRSIAVQMDLVHIEAVVLPDNAASSRVLEKAGMTFEGLLRSYQIWRGRPCDLRMYAVTRA